MELLENLLQSSDANEPVYQHSVPAESDYQATQVQSNTYNNTPKNI